MSEDIPVQSMRTTFEIVQLLSKRGRMRYSDICAILDKPDSTIYDHLQSLKTLGYVTESTEGYTISFEFLLLGHRKRNFVEVFMKGRKELEELAAVTTEHVSLLVVENGRGRTIYTVQGSETVKFKVIDGTETHLAGTAPGKTVLANLPRPSVEEILDQHGLPSATQTYDGRAELLSDLDTIESQGYAIDNQEAIRGMCGIAVPVIDRTEKVRGAISIYGPTGRMSDERMKGELLDQLLEKANIIELNLDLAE